MRKINVKLYSKNACFSLIEIIKFKQIEIEIYIIEVRISRSLSLSLSLSLSYLCNSIGGMFFKVCIREYITLLHVITI